MNLRGNSSRLAILSFVHFTVDYCGGLLIPLAEPTLVNHLGVGLNRVALLVGGTGIIVNAVQPISGWLRPTKPMPGLLLFAPLGAGLIACVGFFHCYWAATILLVGACIAIGLFHPEASLKAGGLSGTRKGLGMSFFLSSGYFGFALGGLVSGIWVEANERTLDRFWILAMPVLVASGLVFLSGLYRTETSGGGTSRAHSDEGMIHVVPALLLCLLIAVNMCTFVRITTLFLVRNFPESQAQGWGGATVFASGITGGVGAFMWGHLSDRFGRARIILITQIACVPFFLGLLNVSDPSRAPLWGLGIGITMGGVFPLGVVLAQQARGLPDRLKMGLAIGGAWGTGEMVFIAAGYYIDRFPPDTVAPVANVMRLCLALLAATAVLSTLVLFHGKRKGH